MIRVQDLRIDYDTVCAVRDLSLEVVPGEVCGLIGPNGAGKTSTMLAMLGLIEPTYGVIELAGVDMRERPRDACRAVGFMPDFPPLYDDLLCWEFLDLFAASYFVPRPARRELIDRALARVGPTEKHSAMVVELSRGMRQRLMLAKTLIPDPQVLLLDEPASGLDPQGRIDLKNVVKGLAAAGKTLLISSHILSEMSEFCTSLAIMERGRMVVRGTIAEIQERVMGGAVVVIEVIGDSAALESIVASDPMAGSLERVDGTFAIRYRGGDAEASDLLAALIRGGVRVSSFARRREGLEEVFLKVGPRELA
jgi:ABC-2 type transport system ATP-binding protein